MSANQEMLDVRPGLLIKDLVQDSMHTSPETFDDLQANTTSKFESDFYSTLTDLVDIYKQINGCASTRINYNLAFVMLQVNEKNLVETLVFNFLNFDSIEFNSLFINAHIILDSLHVHAYPTQRALLTLFLINNPKVLDSVTVEIEGIHLSASEYVYSNLSKLFDTINSFLDFSKSLLFMCERIKGQNTLPSVPKSILIEVLDNLRCNTNTIV